MLIRTAQKYEHIAGFYGLCLRDEPTDDYLDYAQLVREVNHYNPHIEVYLNQFPMVSVHGDSDTYYADVASISAGNGRLYHLSFDNYPHLADGTYNPEFYRDMNALRKAGILYNCETAYYLQAFDRHMLTPEEQMYNAVLGVAYGFKKFQYFVAFNGSDQFGLISPSLTATEMGRNATVANTFILKFERFLGDCDAIEVYHTNETMGQDLLPADFAFTHVGGGEAIYSLFEALDGSGRQYILITNKNYEADGAVTFTVKVLDQAAGKKLENDALVFDGVNSFRTNKVPVTVPKKEVHSVDDKDIDGDPVRVGDVLNYKVSFELLEDSESVVVTDKVPDGTTYEEGSAHYSAGVDGTLADGVITWDLGARPAGEYTATFSVTVAPAAEARFLTEA
jgi:hypothetical protein